MIIMYHPYHLIYRWILRTPQQHFSAKNLLSKFFQRTIEICGMFVVWGIWVERWMISLWWWVWLLRSECRRTAPSCRQHGSIASCRRSGKVKIRFTARKIGSQPKIGDWKRGSFFWFGPHLGTILLCLMQHSMGISDRKIVHLFGLVKGFIDLQVLLRKTLPQKMIKNEL